MYKTSIVKCIICLLLFTKCSNNIKKVELTEGAPCEVIEVDLEKKRISYSDIIKKVEFVKLETNENCIIGDVSNVFFTDSSIIVVDKEQAQSVFVFTLEGRFIRKIHHLGKGPGEYSNMWDVKLSHDKKTISIFDIYANTIHNYTLEDKHISSIRTPFKHSNFEFINNKSKAYDIAGGFNPDMPELKDYMLAIADNNTNIATSLPMNYNPDKFNYVTKHVLKKYNDTVYYTPMFSDTIYKVTDYGIEPKYYIDLSFNTIPEITKSTTTQQVKELLKNKFVFLGEFVDLKDFAMFFVATPNANPMVFYSKRRKSSYCMLKTVHTVIDHLFNNPTARYNENTVVVVQHSYEILNNKDNILKNKKDTLLQELLTDLSPDDNPILFFYTIKEPEIKN